MKIGIIGTGLLGSSVAVRLAKSENEVFAYNRTIEKVKVLEKYGIKVSKSVNDLFNTCDYIISVLADYQANQESFSKIESFSDNSAKVFIQISTLAPDENKELEKMFKDKNINYLESPVLGSKKEAESGKLIIMVGGDKAIYEKCEKLFKLLSENYRYIGEIGKASSLKLALNSLIASLTASFSLSLGIIQKSHVDVEIFMDVLRNSALYAPTFDKKLENMLNRNFDNPNFPVKHLLKDVNLIKETAEKLNLDTSVVNGVKNIIEKALTMNLSEKDYSAIFNAIVTD